MKMRRRATMNNQEKQRTIFDNSLRLERMLVDIVESAKIFYEYHPKMRADRTIRECVEFWFENDLVPAFKCAIEDTFEDEEEEESADD
jgi:hypothetical protein